MNKEERVARFKEIDIYPVTCERLSATRTNMEVLGALIKGGARIVQLREKDLSSRELYQLAMKFREMTAKAGMLLMVNDRLDIALSVGADGVHLGQDDLPAAAARIIAPDLIIGVSSHSLDEALQAQKDGADYVNIGPIFPTKTKEGVGCVVGPEAISAISPHLGIPFTVMGGINGTNLDEVLLRGARRVAMVTAITKAENISDTVRSLRKRIRNYEP